MPWEDRVNSRANCPRNQRGFVGEKRGDAAPELVAEIFCIFFVCDLDKRFDGFAVGQAYIVARLRVAFGGMCAVKQPALAHHEQAPVSGRHVEPERSFFGAEKMRDVDRLAPVERKEQRTDKPVARCVGAVFGGAGDCTPVLIAYKPLRDKLGVSLCNYTAGGARRIAFFVVYPDVHAAFYIAAYARLGSKPFVFVVRGSLSVRDISHNSRKPAALNTLSPAVYSIGRIRRRGALSGDVGTGGR